MRKKIAQVLPTYCLGCTKSSKVVDQILTLICEEIEKVENPYPLDMPESEIWEVCRQKILTLLKG